MSILPTGNAVDLALIFSSVISLVVLIILIALIYAMYRSVLEVLRGIGQSSDGTNADKEAIRVMEAARSKAEMIVKDAVVEARKIVDSVESAKDFSGRQLDLDVKEISEKHKELFKEAVENQKSESLTTLASISEEIKGDVSEGIDELKDVLRKEVVESHQEVEKKMRVEQGELEEELEKYRQKRVNEIESSIYELLHNVSVEVFGKALSMEDHRQLVIKALEDAKEKQFFSQKQ